MCGSAEQAPGYTPPGGPAPIQEQLLYGNGHALDLRLALGRIELARNRPRDPDRIEPARGRPRVQDRIVSEQFLDQR